MRNTSGGALGAVTWGTTFRQSAVSGFVAPATGKSTLISFYYSGALNEWVQMNPSLNDVAN